MIQVERLCDKKIVLIDDEIEILDLVETVLRNEGLTNVYKATCGEDGISLCKEIDPDVIVLDIMLPDVDGYEVCKQLRTFTFAPILFLSAKTDDFDKLLGLGVGGDDYITKPFSPKEVAFRVKAQLRRGQYIQKQQTKAVLTITDIVIDTETGEVTKAGKPVTLTAKEYLLFLYMAQNLNRILSRKMLYDHVWGEYYEGYDNTVMVHIRHLREKLEDDPSHPVHIITMKGLGYKLMSKNE
ncbi:response regulator transcription factor [Ectobacillus polymachus]|uniref:response regulator transcription factor n=1 Tax=Ectobacillus polymachus TaxID=1508806 RepID=UPI003A8BC8C6